MYHVGKRRFLWLAIGGSKAARRCNLKPAAACSCLQTIFYQFVSARGALFDGLLATASTPPCLTETVTAAWTAVAITAIGTSDATGTVTTIVALTIAGAATAAALTASARGTAPTALDNRARSWFANTDAEPRHVTAAVTVTVTATATGVLAPPSGAAV